MAGITAAGPGADFGLSTSPSPLRFLRAYQALAGQLGFGVAVLARQVHGARVLTVDAGPGPLPPAGEGWTPRGERRAPEEARATADGSSPAGPAFHSPGEADGLLTTRPGVLLAVTAADCVPVFLVADGGDGAGHGGDGAGGGGDDRTPTARPAALLHAGWRGVAAGVLEEGVRMLGRAGAGPEDLLLHLGPGICGPCYEVGPEVPEALGLEPGVGEEGAAAWRVGATLRVDLRRALAARARALGIPGPRITRSPWCTRCASDRFHSHRGRGATAGRMAAFLGWREAPMG